MAPEIDTSPGAQYALRRSRRRAVIRARYLFLMLVPGVVYFLMFRYAPMFGLVIAFKDFSIFKGIAGSPWVGLDNFRDVFSSPDFWNILRNTLVISAYKIIVGFPVPIILALAMNEMRSPLFKRTVQTVIYLPYFISWVVIGGIVLTIFSPTTGFLAQVTTALTGNRMNILASRAFFRPILVLSDVWKSAGWGTIIYLAALSQVDPNLYEAAIVDGANRWQQTVHITLPTISGVIVLLLILRIGWIMYAGFEQILVLQNAIVRDISDVFETFVYRVGLGKGEYTFTATAELFKSVVSLVLVLAADRFAKFMGEEGLI